MILALLLWEVLGQRHRQNINSELHLNVAHSNNRIDSIETNIFFLFDGPHLADNFKNWIHLLVKVRRMRLMLCGLKQHLSLMEGELKLAPNSSIVSSFHERIRSMTKRTGEHVKYNTIFI